MNFLPNHNLAIFLQKQLFVEQRCIFVSEDEKKMMEAMMGVEFNDKTAGIDDEGFITQDLKNIGHDMRAAIDLKVDKDGYIGLAGGNREMVSENYNESLEDLLREKGDYDSAIKGTEMKIEDFEDPLGYQLLGGRDGLPVKLFSGDLGKSISKKYNALLKIKESLKNQSKGTAIINESIRKYRQEIEEEREEYLKLLEQERQAVLDKIVAKIEAEKLKLDKELKDFEDICVEPEALKEAFEVRNDKGKLVDIKQVGFFDNIKKKTDVENLLKKIREGKVTDAEVEEASEQIQYMKRSIAERRTSVEELQYLHKHDEEREKVVGELLKNVKKILADYRLKDSKQLNSKKAPQNPAEKKFVMQFIQFEEKLESGEVSVGEIAFIDDVLTKLNKGRKAVQRNVSNPKVDISENVSSAKLERKLKDSIKNALNVSTPINAEVRKLSKDTETKILTLQSELNEKNFGNFAQGKGKIKSEELRKEWLVDKFESLKNLEVRQDGIKNSPLEKRTSFVAQHEIRKYLNQIENASNPLEVVDKLKTDGHLKVLSAKLFDTAYRETGITNSYLVIEQQVDEDPQVPNYSGQDWTIYLDEVFYQKLKNGEGDKNRFKARIAHELGHREFEVEVKKKLENAAIYNHEEWDKFESRFNDLIKGKKLDGKEDILNELYALSRENAVDNIKNNEELKNLVDDFTAFIWPMLKVRDFKAFGAIAETGGETLTTEDAEEGKSETGETSEETSDEEQMAGLDETTSTSEKQGEESENIEQARKLAVTSFTDFKNYIKLFGGKLGEEEEGSEDEVGMDLSRIPMGPEALQHAVDNYPVLKNAIENIDSIQSNSVVELNKWFSETNNQFKQIEEHLSSKEAGQPNYFQQLWSDTRFLSADDIFHIVTESWEFMQRRRDRNSQDARAAVGQKLFKGIPGLDLLSNEYLSKQQKLEQDEVGEYQGNLKNMSHEEIYPLLFKPKNKDHLKAIIYDLTERGRMRWDDHRIWEALGRFTFIKIPNRNKADNDVIYRNEWLKKMVADIWDENTWDAWRKSNDGGLDSALGDLKREADDLHNLGLKPVTDKLDAILAASESNLGAFKKGKGDEAIIPSHRYQKYLDYAFEFGKLTMEDKFYYLIAGVRNRVIPIEYFKKIQTDRFLILPILDFFYSQNNTYNDVVGLYDEIQKNGGKDGVHKMLMQKVLHDPWARKRLQKLVSRDQVRDIDHDDWQALMAGVRASAVDGMLVKRNGAKALVTDASLINGMTSYSTFAKAQKGLIDEQGSDYECNDLVDSIKSFVAYDSRLMGRVGRENQYENIADPSVLAEEPFGHGLRVSDYQKSMYDLISKVFKIYSKKTGVDGSKYSQEYCDLIFSETVGLTPETLKEKKKKGGMEESVNSFATKMDKLSETDAGQDAIRTAIVELSGNMAGYQGRGFDYTIQD